ncbi:hypothetical protein DCS32_03820 [Dokdonia sp. Dokd-P16]|uniref:hypothetical protein n=1 Tax=Dokdonia sp. Dokd-P16 TaxID=2173169 RepID=UPI000D54733C|nr:hypothetical protein [Dokdonia sp. Dokd-P16]AWH73315.1 hypothetical protein DCS32_03820 [Dokdonia sp. Dokd-P16]
MILNENILNDFGRLIIKDGYDSGINLVDDLKQITKPPYIIKEEASFVKSLNDEQINGLKKLIKRTQSDLIFTFLKIFEEQENYKLIYEENGKQVNLEEISEMLKAEPTIENGWIDRFSKYSDKK